MEGAKIVLQQEEAGPSPDAKAIAEVVMARFGLLPRKKGSTEKMHQVLLQLYERTKQAQRERRPEIAVMTVEELGYHAGISRQTMYEYLERWLVLDLITKTSFIKTGSVIIGYRLNGSTLEAAFEKAGVRIQNHFELSMKYVRELQKLIKNEKISAAQERNISRNSSNICAIETEISTAPENDSSEPTIVPEIEVKQPRGDEEEHRYLL